MTSVLGHLMALDFESQYKGWQSCPPGSLFEAPVHEYVEVVRMNKLPCLETTVSDTHYSRETNITSRTSSQSQRIYVIKPDPLRLYLSGPIVIERENILVPKSVCRPKKAMGVSSSKGLGSATRKGRKNTQTNSLPPVTYYSHIQACSTRCSSPHRCRWEPSQCGCR